MPDGWQQNTNYNQNVVVTSGQQNSAVADLKEKTLCGLYMPAAFTGTSVTFLASTTSAGTYVTVTDGAGNDYSVTVAVGKYVPVDPAKFLGIRFLKIRSGSAEGADRTVGLAVRNVE